MDNILPSPSYNLPSIGTPHHGLEEDQMINPQAAAQQVTSQGDPSGPLYSFGGFTPHQGSALLSSSSSTPSAANQLSNNSSNTPQNLLNSPAPASIHQSNNAAAAASSSLPGTTNLGGGPGNVYAPIASPAPATPLSLQPPGSMDPGIEIGRASCRERV
eukprot:TRINITY_DN4668_c0_g1_i2.p1 TRINITY_DN4668_c0_g1~~TRINITY_DN4668_c0_g1_i2.p1  ORF type:complete len:159 (+),score=63.39 TRINITY_DN4668_c0_g1_i2:86-562(+)